MPKFRKKPVEIEAIQVATLMKEPRADWPEWAQRAWFDEVLHLRASKSEVKICTLEGNMVANDGDWIIRGVKGELYPCKPDIFAATYEPA